MSMLYECSFRALVLKKWEGTLGEREVAEVIGRELGTNLMKDYSLGLGEVESALDTGVCEDVVEVIVGLCNAAQR